MSIKHYRRYNVEPYKSLIASLDKYPLKGHVKELIIEKILMGDITTDTELAEEVRYHRGGFL